MLDDLKRCYVIAEIGGNFTDYSEAVALIDAAKSAGVDCVKLQTYKAGTISCRSAYFDMENTGKTSQYEYFKKYEISKELHKKIFDYADSKGLDWFSTPSHESDVDMLLTLGIKAFKIGADDATNIPLIKYIAGKGLPVAVSTGMCTLEEVREMINAITEEGNKKIIILHTVSAYPTCPEHVNLNVIKTLQAEFPGFPIGFSDHTMSILASISAVAMGASVIERHFTLDKNAIGPDHILSSDPKEMKYLVDSIRTIEKMLGTGVKAPYGPEIRNRTNNRKSVISTRNIGKGEIFSVDNIAIKRPGSGIQPVFFEKIIGHKAKRAVKEDVLISWKDVN